MKPLHGVFCLALVALLMGCERKPQSSSISSGSEITASARERGTNTSDAATAEPDNTGRNARDRSGEGLPPGDQEAGQESVSDKESGTQYRKAE